MIYLRVILKTKLRASITPLLLMIACKTFGQAPDTAGLKKMLDAANKYHTTLTHEKTYLQFDKPFYAVGDTVWMKAYVLMNNTASPNSSKLYVELLNASGKLTARLTLPVAAGLATGYFPLDNKTIAEGSYTVRSYTNWQQNFGPESFYYHQFSVGKLADKTWLVTEQNIIDNPADSDHIRLAMRFTDAKGLPLVTHKLNVQVLDNNKPVLKSEMTTGGDGTLSGGFRLPAKTGRKALSLALTDADDKSRQVAFPFYPSGSGGDIDLQFMPEGGSLVAGVLNKIGFKAIGEDGLGRDVNGKILDSKGNDAGTIQSLHGGMGSFLLVPQAGELYLAEVVLNGRIHKYRLPAVKVAGVAMRVDAVSNPDELSVTVTGSQPGEGCYALIVGSLDRVYFGSEISLNGEGYFSTHIKKSLFPTGILKLTILGPGNTPLNQRTVFINRHDQLQIKSIPGSNRYTPDDSIAVRLQVTDNAGNPKQGNFTVAVTDDAQVKDKAAPDNIVSHMQLASEIKGNIENPAWYFAPGDDKLKERALDNLMLTQGWLGFDWEKLIGKQPIAAFNPESDNSISGSLKNFFGKPAKGLNVMLMSKSKYQNVLIDTLSDNDGRFRFKHLPLADTAAYLIKLHNKHNSTAAAGITVDEFNPATATLTGLPRLLPWNINTDSTLINYINQAGQRNYNANPFVPLDGSKLLKQVEIRAQRKMVSVGSEFAVELMTIDEKELIAAKKMSLFDLLYKKLPGFKESHIPSIRKFDNPPSIQHVSAEYKNGYEPIWDIVADGKSVGDPTTLPDDIGEVPQTDDAFFNMKQFLNSLGADDVKSISLNRGIHEYLVITTRSGAGPFAAPSLGVYGYRPPVMQLPRQFYRPRYTVKSSQPDLRSTIHWEPNVVTDANGNASLSFYAADKPGTYTVTIEGTDMQGHFGVSSSKITVTQALAGEKN